MSIFDGWNPVVINGVPCELRSCHAVIRPFLPRGEHQVFDREGNHVGGILLGFWETIPTMYAEIVAVSPPLGVEVPIPEVGDVVVFQRYASEQINAPFLKCEPHHDGDMAKATRGLHFLNLRDAIAIVTD